MELLIFIALLFLVISFFKLNRKSKAIDKKLDLLLKLITDPAKKVPSKSKEELIIEKPKNQDPEPKESIPEPPPTPVFVEKTYLVEPEEIKPEPYSAAREDWSFKKEEKKKERKPSFMERNPDLEKFIGENLLSKVGIVIFVIGMGFLVKLGIDNNIINEGLRVAIGVVIGGGMIGLAHYLRKSFSKFSSILIGGALAVLYFTIALAFHEYHLVPQTAAFVMMVFITLIGIILSLSYNRVELAVLAVIGGFGTPFFVSEGSGNIGVLFSYILILDIGMLVLAYFKKWNLINYLSYIFTFVLFSGVYFNNYQENPALHRNTIFLGLTSFYLIFFLINLIYNVKNKVAFKPKEIVFLISNAAIYFGFGLAIFNEYKEGLYSGLFTALIAIFNFIFSFILFKRKDIDKNLLYLLIGLVLTFVSLIAPIQLDGNNITLFWSIEAVLLLWLSKQSRLELLKGTALLMNVLMLISLVLDWKLNYHPVGEYILLDLFLNKVFITTLTVIISMLASLKIFPVEELVKLRGFKFNWKKSYLKVALSITLYIGLFFELDYQFTKFDFSYAIKDILLGIYNVIFTLILIYYERFNKNKYLKIATDVISGLLILSYVTKILNPIEYLRNSFINQEETIWGFMWHYLLLILSIILVVNLSKSIFKRFSIKSKEFNIYLWILGAISVIVLSAEVMHLSIIYQTGNGTTIYEAKRIVLKAVYPIVWSIGALIFMIVGMKFRLKTIRLISLVLFLITIIKLFIYDLADNTTGKVVSFIFLGVILLLISFLYQKLKFIIQDDEQDSNPS